MEVFAAEMGKAGIGRVRITDSIRKEEIFPDTSCHHLGTTRMSDNPRHGVVDRDCKVHDVPNLYVASSSVFPTGGWANPTLTITALSLRLADHIKKSFNKG